MTNRKKHLRRGIIYGLKPFKLAIKKSPKLKRIIRNIVLEQMSLGSASAENSRYQTWLNFNYPDAVKLFENSEALKKLTYKPLISILTPTYNTNIQHLYDCIMSVRTQLYQNWELCIVDDASTDEKVKEEIKKHAKEDSRIKYKFRDTNGHISAATNDALDLASGEYVGLLDHDDILWPNALFEMVKALNGDESLDFLYSDEDKICLNREDHQNPFFKPDWNPEFLESVNYITHFAVIRKKLVEKVGGFRSKYDGAQDWDLFLRVCHATKHIYHVPTILYSWRISETSTAYSTDTKPYVSGAQKNAITESLKDRGNPMAKVLPGVSKDYWSVEYPIDEKAKVSIVIPSKNQSVILKRCIESIYKKTTYKNFEIILVDTGSTNKKLLRWYKTINNKHSNFHVIFWPESPFSYARACNYGVQNSKGEYLLFLNNDTEVITANWIELLLSDAQRDNVGPVGCKLYYPNGTRIQHAGIGIGFGGFAANSLSLLHNNELSPLQHLYANTRHEVSAVTAACMMVKKDRFNKVGGFDEKFRVTYNDVDLCLRLGQAGYRSIYNPSVELIHYESISVGKPTNEKKRDTNEFTEAKKLFVERWSKKIAYDPHLNPNITRDNALFEIKVDYNKLTP